MQQDGPVQRFVSPPSRTHVLRGAARPRTRVARPHPSLQGARCCDHEYAQRTSYVADVSKLSVTECPDAYSGSEGNVQWRGVSLGASVLQEIRSHGLVERAQDIDFAHAVADEARALADTEMETATLERFILNAEGPTLDWQVGEAVAEVLLKEWHGAVWVWNGARDRKVRKASLPGADVVGFQTGRDALETRFLFGEVKSSKDVDSPPHVLYGRSGMINQLEVLASGKDLWTLVRWFRARCTDAAHLAMYKDAVRYLLSTQGKGIALVGCLVRDTAAASEADLKSRAKTLAKAVDGEMTAMLHAWYMTLPMDEWPSLLEDSTNG